MEKLIDLRLQFENILNPSIEFNLSVNNYLFDNHWVTDIRKSSFEKKQNEFLNYIKKEFDYNDKTHVKFLKIRFNALIKSCKLMQENNHESLSFFESNDWNSILNSPDHSPNSSPTILGTPNPKNNFDDRNEHIIEIMKGFYNLDGEIEKYFEEEGDELRYMSQDILNYFLKEKLELDEYEIEQSYAKAHLSYIISLHNQMVRNIGKDIKKRIDVIEELESFDEDISNVNSTTLENPNEIKLELAMKKQDIAIFFHTLHNLGIIKTDTNDVYDSQNKLKSFINNANFYYTFNKQLTKVDRINKEFTPLNNKEINEKEIEFLENIISKFNTRVQEIKFRES